MLNTLPCKRGFTLIELIIVVTIISILGAIATMMYRDMVVKASVENQIKMMYADLLEVRQKALLEKSPRCIKFTPGHFSIFQGTDTSVPPVYVRDLVHPVTLSRSDNPFTLTYDTWGICDLPVSVCVEQNSTLASTDALVISKTRVRMGKLAAGKSCRAENVSLK